MANEILLKEGTPVVFADATDYSATNSGFTRTHQLDLTSLANGAARQSDRADFGVTRARIYTVRVGIEIDVAPVAGALVEFYFSPSFSASVATAHDGGAAGADGAWRTGDEAEWTKQLILLGALVCTADAAPTVQKQTIGQLSLPHRYGSVIVYNTSGQALEGDAVEMYVAFVPAIDEVQ